MLFILADWHALAKLRLHTDTTLTFLHQATRILGTRLRNFVKHICPEYDTKELAREEAARARRRKRKGQTSAVPALASKKRKLLNLLTYKMHALGDYVPSIPMFGTSDSYSTQPVSDSNNHFNVDPLLTISLSKGELEHRRVKKFYARTNKNFSYMKQITRLERREKALERRRRNMDKLQLRQEAKRQKRSENSCRVTVALEESESLGYTPPDVHHHISHSRNYPVPLRTFMEDEVNDIAIKVC